MEQASDLHKALEQQAKLFGSHGGRPPTPQIAVHPMVRRGTWAWLRWRKNKVGEKPKALVGMMPKMVSAMATLGSLAVPLLRYQPL